MRIKHQRELAAGLVEDPLPWLRRASRLRHRDVAGALAADGNKAFGKPAIRFAVLALGILVDDDEFEPLQIVRSKGIKPKRLQREVESVVVADRRAANGE